MVTLLPVFMLLFCLFLFDWAVLLNEQASFKASLAIDRPTSDFMIAHYQRTLSTRLSVVKAKTIVFFGLMTPGLLQVLSQ